MSSGLTQATKIPLPLDRRQATLHVPPFIQESSSDYPLPTERSVVAASCIWFDEDRRGHKGPPPSVLLDENQADCFLFGGSRCEKPKAAGKPQMGENKKYSPDPLVRFCLEEPGVKAPGLSVGQRTRTFLPRSFLPEYPLLRRGCDCLGPPWKTSAAGRLACVTAQR